MIRKAMGVLLFVFVIAWPQHVSAHVLAADGQIGAFLHIEPADNPVTDTQTRFVLSFQDTSRRFTLQNCQCVVVYAKDGSDVMTQRLADGTGSEAASTVTFEEAGNYTLKITGAPTENGDSFQPFELTYDFRVASGEIETRGLPPLLLVGMTGMVALLLVGAYKNTAESMKE